MDYAGVMNKRLIPLAVIMALMFALYYAADQRSNMTLSDEPLVLHRFPPEIVMFGTQSCQYCQLAREFFKQHHLSYQEHDIEKSDEHRRMFDLLGGRGTPLIIINRELIHGFDEAVVRKAL